MIYLSEPWLEAATKALIDAPPTQTSLRVGYDIIDGPDGVGPYTLVLGPETMAFEPGLSEPAATLRLTFDLAVAIAKGMTSAQRAFLDGKIQLGGDVTALLGSTAHLELIDDKLKELRATTRFPDSSE